MSESLLIVEDGTGVEKANAYITVEEADVYHTARLNVAWAGTRQQKEAAIIKATEFIDGRYGRRFTGEKVFAMQRRAWPRFNVPVEGYYVGGTSATGVGLFPSNTVPDQVKDATCEAAVRAISGPLTQDLPRGGKIKRKKTDVLETEFFSGAPSHTTYEVLDMLLAPFVSGSSSTEVKRA